MTTKKHFDVTIICPIRGNEVTHKHVSSDSLRQNDSGETVFRYNDHYDSCEVISVVEVPQSKMDAMARYFEKYGTANE
jgi:hypothetical protein